MFRPGWFVPNIRGYFNIIGPPASACLVPMFVLGLSILVRGLSYTISLGLPFSFRARHFGGFLLEPGRVDERFLEHMLAYWRLDTPAKSVREYLFH